MQLREALARGSGHATNRSASPALTVGRWTMVSGRSGPGRSSRFMKWPNPQTERQRCLLVLILPRSRPISINLHLAIRLNVSLTQPRGSQNPPRVRR